jgi:hypothetical protein
MFALKAGKLIDGRTKNLGNITVLLNRASQIVVARDSFSAVSGASVPALR